MFIIGEALVEEQIITEQFACDVGACKGACCTLPGGRGAPLQDDEVAEVQHAFPFAKRFLDDRHRQAIEERGCVEGVPGSYATNCIDERDCVFVFYEDGIARCSIEKAYYEGLISWQKPLSCHLFPIRVSSGSAKRLHYEKIWQCEAARPNGRNLNMPLHVFLKTALVRAFGMSWYETLHRTWNNRKDSSAASSS
ncbi:MAG TPA: DUF3109 family protein [Bacteroidota bacterium]|nr:DUF3109 family protein [Bacteroidota bacterium]